MSAIKFLPINNSCLVYNENFCNYIKDYYDYVSMLLYKILENNPQLNIIIVFENLYLKAIASDPRKMVYIYLNIEHTLVRPGGRSTENAVKGNIPVVGIGEEKGEKYLVRIDKYQILQQKHVVIEYSNPNIINVRESGVFRDFVDKMIYISPLVYEPQFGDTKSRNINCLTTFINTGEPRRRALLTKAGSQILNVNNCFNRYDLQALYSKTKVMINIHQTDHHHTFEELRVLPALCCGVIVVCERSPLWENVPYHEFIIWADYGEVLEKSREVLENYEECYNFIFGGEKLSKLIAKMEKDNYDRLLEKIRSVCA